MSMGSPLPDFDALVALHQYDPEAFEDFRRHVLREAIDCAPQQHRPRLEALLEQIEDVRSKAESPMDAVRLSSEMMRQSAAKLCEAWDQAHEAVAGLQAQLIIDRVRAQRTPS